MLKDHKLLLTFRVTFTVLDDDDLDRIVLFRDQIFEGRVPDKGFDLIHAELVPLATTNEPHD